MMKNIQDLSEDDQIGWIGQYILCIENETHGGARTNGGAGSVLPSPGFDGLVSLAARGVMLRKPHFLAQETCFNH